MVNTGRSGVVVKCVAADAEAVDSGGQGEVEEGGEEAFVWQGGFVQNTVKTLLYNVAGDVTIVP